MNTYQTTEVARIIGVHPNTVRLYEQLHLIPLAKRQKNGYRIFTDFHIEQFRLARTALKVEILKIIGKKAMNIIKVSATGNFDMAIKLTDEYLSQLEREKHNAEQAIQIVNELLNGESSPNQVLLKRKEVSEFLGITMDTLRNWELNGLLCVKRKANGYRVYSNDDIKRLRIIKALRYSLFFIFILRMLLFMVQT